jgi:uncharacterized protein YndB with AHSA1/START domain
MKILKGLFYIIVTLILLFVVIGFFLPQQQHVEREIVISASPAEIFQKINDPKSFNQWSPWAEIDPNTDYTYVGPESGKGAGMTWSSENPNVGSGSWMITESKLNQTIKVDLDFGSEGKATSFYDLKLEGEGTRITWGFDMDAGMNPMNRWFGLMMDKWIGADYEKGLAKLKTLIEQDK